MLARASRAAHHHLRRRCKNIYAQLARRRLNTTQHEADDDESWWDEETRLRMPGTVSKLHAPDGVVYLIGTAHLSTASQQDVSKVIRAVEPHIVCIELCSARLRFLEEDRRDIIELPGETGTMKLVQGGEFRRAVQEARSLRNGCVVQLIDRPINITLRRALNSLSVWQMAKLAWHLSASSSTMTVEKMEALKRRGAAEEALKPLADAFPALHHVMVGERDLCMAYLLQNAVKADKVNRPGVFTKVVGVVGVGHVPGITRHFGFVTMADVLPLLESPPPRLTPFKVFGGVSAAMVGTYLFVRLLF